MEVNGTIIIQILIFMALLLWLSQSLFNPLIWLFDEREKRISGSKILSEQMALDAQKKSAQFDEGIISAKNEAKKMLSEMKAQNLKEQMNFLADIKQKAKEKLNLAENELLAQEKSLKDTMLATAQDLSEEIIQLLKRPKA